MAQESWFDDGQGVFAEALARLDRAVRALEIAIAERRTAAHGADENAVAASAEEQARLRAELDAAKARERALEAVAAEASAALGRAAAEVRAALAAEER